SSRRRHTRSYGDWSSDVCSSDLRQHGLGRCREPSGTRPVLGPPRLGGPTEAPQKSNWSMLSLVKTYGCPSSTLSPLISTVPSRQIGRASCRERMSISRGGVRCGG